MRNKKFKGKLRLCNDRALKTLRYSITTKEIIAIAYAFMREHNKPINKNLHALSIYFINETRYKKTGLNKFLPTRLKEYTAGEEKDNYLAGTADIHLFLPHLKTKKAFIKTLIHELDHVVWGLENEGRFNFWLPYDIRPHERRANKSVRRWYRKAKKITEQYTK